MNKQKLQKFINEYLSKYKGIKILDAGCGSDSKLRFSGDTYIEGIDISQKHLDRNNFLDEKILGDIQSFKLNKEYYDVIVCWYVLEHLSKPRLAIDNFLNAIKNEGIIIIASPNPNSIKGFVTKFTPHWFHIFFHKCFYNKTIKEGGDIGPFKTYMRYFIRPQYLINYVQKKGFEYCTLLTEDALEMWPGNYIRSKSKLLFNTLNFFRKLIKLLSFNLIGESEYIIILSRLNIGSNLKSNLFEDFK